MANTNPNKTAATQTPAQASATAGVKHDLSYDDKVIQKIVGIATKDVPGVLAVSGGIMSGLNSKLHVTNQDTSGIDAEVGKKQVALDMNVVVEYGKYVPETFDAVIAKVTKSVKDMTGLDVIEVNMHVQDVLSAQDFESMRQQQESSVKENLGIGQKDGQQQAQQPQYPQDTTQYQTRVQ